MTKRSRGFSNRTKRSKRDAVNREDVWLSGNARSPATQQSKVAAAFDALAPRYDDTWTNSVIGRLQRESVWRAIDGIFMSRRAYSGSRLWNRESMRPTWPVPDSESTRPTSHRRCCRPRGSGWSEKESRTSDLRAAARWRISSLLKERGPFDGAISNFGAINCVKNLRGVRFKPGRIDSSRRQAGHLLDGPILCLGVALVPRACQPGKAIRRWSGAAPAGQCPEDRDDSQGSLAPVAAALRFFIPRSLRLPQPLAGHFRLIHLRSIGVFVPPSYMESWARAAPAFLRRLGRLDFMVGAWPGLRAIGDHRLLILGDSDYGFLCGILRIKPESLKRSQRSLKLRCPSCFAPAASEKHRKRGEPAFPAATAWNG